MLAIVSLALALGALWLFYWLGDNSTVWNLLGIVMCYAIGVSGVSAWCEGRGRMVALLLACAFIPSAAQADCGQFFRQAYRQTYYAPTYVQPTYYVKPYYVPAIQYRAGQDIEAEALAEKVARKVTEKLSALQLRQAAANDKTSVLAEYCGDCHSGASPKKGLTYDGGFYIPAEQVTRALKAIRDDKMPPPDTRNNAPLSPQVKGALMEALLAMEGKPEPDDGGLE